VYSQLSPRRGEYAHVTYFFNSVEEPFLRTTTTGALCALPRTIWNHVGVQVTEQILRGIEKARRMFSSSTLPARIWWATRVSLISYRSLPVRGHLPRLDYQKHPAARGITLITADHGNAEQMLDPIRSTAHRPHKQSVHFHLSMKLPAD
jgi:hypothetical protein